MSVLPRCTRGRRRRSRMRSRGRLGEGGSPGAVDVQAAGRALQQAGVGQKTRSAGREPVSDRRAAAGMDMTFTGRGLEVTDTIRGLAEQKLAPLGRIEPRATALDLELINEHHPRMDGVKRVEAALRIPRKTFRAH